MATARRTVLPRSKLEVSRIGLGLAHLHLMPAARRVALIERALELGITHLDTARLYSDGLSERTVGAVLGARRPHVTITTKFGMLPTPVVARLGRAAWPVRKARSLLHKLKVVPYPRRAYDVATMQKALVRSLRALRTDYIDIYHVHDPEAGTALGDDLIEALLRAKQAGKVRFIGVAGGTIDAVVARHGKALDVIQSAESSWSDATYVPDITHSLFSEAARGRSLHASEVQQLLQRALARRPEGAVILQTRDPERLGQLVELAGAR